MEDNQPRRFTVTQWCILYLALACSVAAILLHLTRLMDRAGDGSNRYGMPETQVLYSRIDALTSELRQLKSEINDASSFSALKKSLGVPNMSYGSPPPPGMVGGPGSPDTAAGAAEQLGIAARSSQFDSYQQIHPTAGQTVLEELFLKNRELKKVYTELLTAMEGKIELPDVFLVLSDIEPMSLANLVFPTVREFEVLDTTASTATSAKVKVRITEIQEVPDRPDPRTSTRTVDLNAVREQERWKITDEPAALAHQKKLLTKLTEHVKKSKELLLNVRSGKISTPQAFKQEWEALPLYIKDPQ